ncbi:MAG: sugar phosphate isomerase/epimerase [Clostridia bacterium]|nr:sugar phosphate isomerase/epimerase [Clostridia bacterium]
MNRVLCSTGTLLGRPNGRDFTLLHSLVPKLHCDGLELLMYDTWYGKTKELTTTMKKMPLPVYVFHLEKTIGEDIGHYRLDDALEKMEINCALAKSLQATTLVLHLWNGIISDKNIGYNIECYKYLEEIAEKHNLNLTVENVVCSNQSPMTHFSTLIEKYPNIKFTYDTKMADFHKEQDLIYSPNYRHIVNNFAHLHINDRLGEYKDWTNLKVLHIGHGSVDFDRFFSFIKAINYKGDFTTEATSFNQEGKINIDLLNESLDKIRLYIHR